MGQETKKQVAEKQANVIDLKKVKRNKTWCGFLAILAIMGGQIIYSVAQESYVYSKGNAQNLVLAILLSGVSISVLELFYNGLLRLSNSWDLGQKKLKGNDFLISLGGLVIILLLQLMGAALGAGHTSDNQEALNKLMRTSGKQIYAMLCLLAPICEELIYRGFFFQVLQLKKGKFEKIVGVVLSGLLFAFVHDPNFDVFFISYFLMGAVLAGLYAWTENLTVSMTAHALNNIIAVAISGI